MKCTRCNGTGKYMGNGMIMANCYLCDDEGDMVETNAVVSEIDQIDRKSESYKKAIKDIRAVNPGISKKEAVKMFNDAYQKVG
jgi:hypothetical protein